MSQAFNLVDLIIFILSSISFRWLLFEYKKFQFLRDLIDKTALKELNQCVFCQSFETGLIIFLLNRFFPIDLDFFFLPLICGFIGIVSYPIVEYQIRQLEEINHFNLTTNESNQELK